MNNGKKDGIETIAYRYGKGLFPKVVRDLPPYLRCKYSPSLSLLCYTQALPVKPKTGVDKTKTPTVEVDAQNNVRLYN